MKSVASYVFCGLTVFFLAFRSSPCNAQNTQSWPRQELQSLGIDVNNTQSILDALRSLNSRVRFLAINFCGQQKIQEALPIFRVLFRQYGTTESFSEERSIGDRSQILQAVMNMADTTFHEEFKMEIDSLQANRHDSDVRSVIQFSSYLGTMYQDDYGFASMLAYYSRIQEYDPRGIIMPVSYLRPFITQRHRDHLIPVLRKTAVEHPDFDSRMTSLSFLLKLQDPQVEGLAVQIASTDADYGVRSGARLVLRDLKSPLYVTSLVEAARSETKYRSMNYDFLIATRQPSAYKYVCDVLSRNSDPESNKRIMLDLENPYLFYWPPDEPTGLFLDSLIAAVPQVLSYGWVGDAAFSLELIGGLQGAKQMLGSGDSSGCARAMRSFQEDIDRVYKDSLNRDGRNVTIEGRRFLSYNAQHILDRLSQIHVGIKREN